MKTVFLGLGSNVGDRAAHREYAREHLGKLPGTRLIAASRVEETAPLGPAAGEHLPPLGSAAGEHLPPLAHSSAAPGPPLTGTGRQDFGGRASRIASAAVLPLADLLGLAAAMEVTRQFSRPSALSPCRVCPS